jgi:hypothetical protein
MKNSETKARRLRPIYRYFFAFLGVVLMGTSAVNLAGGRLQYHSYWGALVFAPFVIFAGLLVLVSAFRLGKQESGSCD